MTTFVDLEAEKEKMLDYYDPDQLVDILNISSEELLDRFPDKLEEYLREGQSELSEETDSDS